MCPTVSGDGSPRWNQIVTLSLPTDALSSSGSMNGSSRRQRVNHAACARGSRTARLKCPTGPTVNGSMSAAYPSSRCVGVPASAAIVHERDVAQLVHDAAEVAEGERLLGVAQGFDGV